MKRILLWIKQHAVLGLWLCILLSCLSLSARLLWLASQTETGLTILRLQWRDATIGWILGNHQPITSREPSEQAEFWLPEVDRILKAHPNDARMTMGAALVLDSPANGYIARYSKAVSLPSAARIIPTFDNDGIKRAKDAFEKRCKQRCLELAAKATEFDSANVEWRRMRASLLSRDSGESREIARDPRWREILDECARHDPENALYDYLAAYFFWEENSEFDYSAQDIRLIVKDDLGFRKGIECFERGQIKPYLAFSNVGSKVMEEFLEKSRLPITEHPIILNSNSVDSCYHRLLFALQRLQAGRADEMASNGEIEKALSLDGQYLHLLDQYKAQNAMGDEDTTVSLVKTRALWILKTHTEKRKNPLNDAETKRIVSLLEAAQLDIKVSIQAMRENIVPSAARQYADFGIALYVAIAPSFISLLLSAILVLLMLARRFTKDEVPVVGPLGQIFAFLIALTVVFALFGLMPAKIVPVKVQEWIFTVGFLISPCILVFWICWRWLQRHSYQFSIRAMLIGTVVFYLLLGVIFAFASFITDFPFHFSMPARDCEGVNAVILEDAITNKYGICAWAAYQWFIYYGHCVTLLVWTGLIALFYLRKIRKRQCQTDVVPFGLRKFTSGLLRSFARPAMSIAVFLFLAYLMLTPIFLDRIEKEFQKNITFARSPESCLAEIKQKIKNVRSDEASMNLLKAASKVEEVKSTEDDESAANSEEKIK
jgi:hypothetical protein